jgi:dual oxidase
MQQEELKNNAGGKTSVDKMAVREWLHANHRRLVKVKFGPEAAIHTVDRKGEKLRTVNFRMSEALTVEESQVSTLTSHNSMQCVAYTGMY